MSRENNLGTDDIRKLVLRLAIPSMLAQFVNVLYSIVDRMYIGNIPVIGDTALAGAGICGPVVTMISAFAAWIGVGGAPLLSIKLGEQDKEGAKRVLGNCFLMLVGMAVLITIVVLLLKERLLWWFGATESIFPYADAYMSVYVPGTLFAILSLGLNQFIICQGYAKTGMCTVILGAVCNIVLDPIFIFGLDMGVAGAAAATVLSQFVSCIFTLFFLFGKRAPIGIAIGGYDRRIIGKVLALGLTPFLIILFDNVLIIAQNMVLKRYGGAESDMLLTCNTIVQSLMLMVTMPLGGITGGTQTILGYNYGAGNRRRVLEGEKQIVKVAVCFTTILFLCGQTMCGLFVRIFTSNPEYIAMTKGFIRIYILSVIPLGVQYALVDGFTGMGIAKIALSLSFFRKAVYLVLVVVLPAVFGAARMFWAEPVSDLLSPVVTSMVYAVTIHKILDRRCGSRLQKETGS